MQENMFGEETETLRKYGKAVTATWLGKYYGQEGDLKNMQKPNLSSPPFP